MILKLLNSRYKPVFIFILLFPWVLTTLTRQSIDYGIFSDTTRGWLSGQIHLYDGQTEFYFAPYSILAFVPIVLIPPPFDQLVYTSIILAALIWATWTLTKPVPWWALGIGLATVYTALLVFNGQWDGMVLAALALGWIAVEKNNPWLLGLSLIGLGTKPTNIILPTLLLLYLVRNWSKINIIRLAIIPFLTVIVSGIIAGWNWPMIFINNYQNHPNPPNYVVVTPWTQTLYLRSYWEYLNQVGRIFFFILLIFAFYLLF